MTRGLLITASRPPAVEIGDHLSCSALSRKAQLEVQFPVFGIDRGKTDTGTFRDVIGMSGELLKIQFESRLIVIPYQLFDRARFSHHRASSNDLDGNADCDALVPVFRGSGT